MYVEPLNRVGNCTCALGKRRRRSMICLPVTRDEKTLREIYKPKSVDDIFIIPTGFLYVSFYFLLEAVIKQIPL